MLCLFIHTHARTNKICRLSKILKCASADDTLTLRYEEDGDTVTIVFDDTKKDKQQECNMKLMDLDTEHLGIPDQEYSCKVTMPSAEFQVCERTSACVWICFCAESNS
jgi:proliferating cell nuclear antigen PCNA